MLAHDNMIQIEKELDLAKAALAKANTLMSRSISVDDSAQTFPDAEKTDGAWATMVTDIGTALTAVAAVQAAMSYYPEKP